MRRRRAHAGPRTEQATARELGSWLHGCCCRAVRAPAARVSPWHVSLALQVEAQSKEIQSEGHLQQLAEREKVRAAAGTWLCRRSSMTAGAA